MVDDFQIPKEKLFIEKKNKTWQKRTIASLRRDSILYSIFYTYIYFTKIQYFLLPFEPLWHHHNLWHQILL